MLFEMTGIDFSRNHQYPSSRSQPLHQGV